MKCLQVFLFNTNVFLYVFLFISSYHHIALVARISLTLSLSFIALGRSSGQHPVSAHSCWMYVRAGRPAFARPCVGVHKSTSLMSSSLLLQQCPASLVRLTWIVFVIGGKWPCSWCLVGCCRQDLFKINQTGDISTLEVTSLKLVDKFTYLGSSVESTEKDIETRLTKAWTAINRLSIIWKSDLTDKMKRSFCQAVVRSILLYGCTTWTLTKRLEKKLDGNYTRMLRAILNKSWRQHPTSLFIYRLLNSYKYCYI